MGIRVAINGLGRIGRLVFRLASLSKDIEVVAVNDLVPPDQLAYLVKYDSTHGRFAKDLVQSGNKFVVEGEETQVFSETDPSKLPWKELAIDYVIESTGRFTDAESASKHLDAGAKRVVISAPAKGQLSTFVMGVNHTQFNPAKDFIVSNASCTTNCLAPITKVLLDNFGIEEGLMTTIHAVTSSQPSVDAPNKKNWRSGRGASQNIIPATTGAAKAVSLCLPEVQGKLTGMAFRVPVADVSAVDLTVKLSQSTSYDEICQAMQRAAQGELKGFLHYEDQPLVSSDFISSSYSSIFDKNAGIALSDTFYKIISWYDNEMGYSCRILDLIRYMVSQDN